MKILKWPSFSEQAKYMNKRKWENHSRSLVNKSENWMAEKLATTGKKWTRSARWGYRVFDFWCHELGIAVEVDGPEHIKAIDNYRDAYNLHRSGIKVLRVRNLNEDDALKVLLAIADSDTWKERRKRLGLIGSGKGLAKRRWKEAGCLDDLKVDLFSEAIK